MPDPKLEPMPAKSGARSRGSGRKPDYATIAGLVIAFGGMAAGLILEGGKLRDVAQLTSAMIVFGGTMGAVMITTPLPILVRAARQLRQVFISGPESVADRIDQIISFAIEARKHGIVELESLTPAIQDPFLRKALELVVDGIEPARIRNIMELEIEVFEQNAEAEARVFESAGGYAPTIGIIGAVLGLIQVMKNLANLDEVGRGIAVAFVATIYGVGSANIFFLPAASKIKARAHEIVRNRELMLEGVIGIAERVNSRLIRLKLEAWLESHPEPGRHENARAASADPATVGN